MSDCRCMAQKGYQVLVGSDEPLPGPEDTIRVKFSLGFILAGVITGASIALGTGAVNRWIWNTK